MSSTMDTDNLQPDELLAELQTEAVESDNPVTSEDGSCETVYLEGDLGIVQIHELYTQLGSVLKSAASIEIDAADLKQIDTAAVQLLYAFVQETKSRGLTLVWKQTSETLNSSAEQLGLKGLMGL